jgi:hypothetical protein
MSLAKTLSHSTLEKIQARFNLVEVGSPYLTLISPAMPQSVGACRLFKGTAVHKMVYIGLGFPPAGLDSHMIFAFTAPDSLVPHFTLDSVLAGPHFAFHLDLIPRVDMGANLEYMNALFQPLTPYFDEAKKIEGLIPAHLGPRQYALMSPWMLAYRANEAAFAQIDDAVNKYLDHWFSLVDNGVTAPVAAGVSSFAGPSPAERDRRNRAAIFSPEVDPVWAQVERLVGAETGAKLREILKNQEIEE